MTPSENLKAVRHLVRTPDRWVKHIYKLEGSGIWPFRKPARYCILGALREVAPEHEWAPTAAFLRKVMGTHPSVWQDIDERTHPELIAALDSAIELAERAESEKAATYDPGEPQ